MDQPFDSDVMEDLAAEAPISSADEYSAEDEFDAFGDDHAFTDEIDEFASEDAASFESDAFGDNLEGDLWNDYAESGDEHRLDRTQQSSALQAGQGQRRRANGGGRQNNRRQSANRSIRNQNSQISRNRFSDEFSEDDINKFENEFSDDFTDQFDNEFDSEFGDEFGDEFTETESVNPIDAMEAAIVDALAAEDSDEFLRQIAQGVRRAAQVARRVGQGVGQVARAVGPVASMIPLPQAQMVGAIANIAGQLLADGADEFAALEEILAFAETEDAVDAAAPIIAGLTVRTMMPRISRLNRTTRQQLVRSVRQSTQTLARRQGAPAVRAIPRVVQAVGRTAQRRRVPAQQLPQAVLRTTAAIARNPRLVSQLARATQQASAVTRLYSIGTRTGVPQHLVLQGPVEITIRSR